jgi:hypothetical protein
VVSTLALPVNPSSRTMRARARAGAAAHRGHRSHFRLTVTLGQRGSILAVSCHLDLTATICSNTETVPANQLLPRSLPRQSTYPRQPATSENVLK